MLREIKTPNDIKKLNYQQLESLAKEIREVIIDTVSRNGGHLSSNLGSVEITLAVNYVLNHPEDHVIFDVGHQAYAHKLITGRYARFNSLRKKNGVCGFPSMDESPEDSFTSGHASTSISAALGLCRARDIKGTDETVVAVVGDGALTGGMCYEALNDAGDSGTDMIVVLNDNEMSISQNVGALSLHLARMRRSRMYLSFKNGTRKFLSRIPVVGKKLYSAIEKVHDVIKAMFIRQNIFEAMGFYYIGAIDGHDVKKLIRALRFAKDIGGPVIIHAVTKKGKGYSFAEKEPERFHGPAPFDVVTGKPMGASEIGCGAVAAELLSEMADADRRICAITAAMPVGTGLKVFANRHQDKFFDVGIAEEHAVTMAGGLAAAGMKPYVAIYSTFLQRAFDQIANDVCLNMLPVTFLIDRAGMVGPDGATHNGTMDLTYLSCIPGMTVVAPRDVRYLRRVVEWSRGYTKPLAIRYPKDAIDLGNGFDTDEPIVPGKWEVMMNGSDVVIFAVGAMVQNALMASMELNGHGISAAVVDAMFVKPMDTELIRQMAASSRLVVTIEENALRGGFGEGVAAEMAAMNLNTRVLNLGIPDRPIRHASRSEQLKECGLDVYSVVDAIVNKLNS